MSKRKPAKFSFIKRGYVQRNAGGAIYHTWRDIPELYPNKKYPESKGVKFIPVKIIIKEIR